MPGNPRLCEKTSNVGIRNGKAKAIAPCQRLAGHLGLGHNQIGIEGAKALAAGVAASGSLAYLELSDAGTLLSTLTEKVLNRVRIAIN